jgi:hypothetical protein
MRCAPAAIDHKQAPLSTHPTSVCLTSACYLDRAKLPHRAWHMTVIKGFCPDCAGYKNAQLIHEHEELRLEKDDLGPTLIGGIYRILKCGGCSTIYFQMESANYWGEHVYPESEQHPDGIAEMKELIEQSDEDPDMREGFYEMTYWPMAKRERPDWSMLSDSTLVNLLYWDGFCRVSSARRARPKIIGRVPYLPSA